jgi:hypothetical protein
MGVIVLPLHNMRLKLQDTVPQGTVGAVHNFCWIPAGSFAKWLTDSSSPAPKPSPAEQVALVPDGHYWHTRNTDVTDLGPASGISVVRLSHHGTSVCRPSGLHLCSILRLTTHRKQRAGVKHIQGK